MTEAKREKMREGGRKGRRNNKESLLIYQTAKGIRRREDWKYAELREKLAAQHVEHTFEFVLDDQGIFDLCLHNKRLLLEFDGPEHRGHKDVKARDKKKTELARRFGYRLVRIETRPGLALSSVVIEKVLALL